MLPRPKRPQRPYQCFWSDKIQCWIFYIETLAVVFVTWSWASERKRNQYFKVFHQSRWALLLPQSDRSLWGYCNMLVTPNAAPLHWKYFTPYYFTTGICIDLFPWLTQWGSKMNKAPWTSCLKLCNLKSTVGSFLDILKRWPLGRLSKVALPISLVILSFGIVGQLQYITRSRNGCTGPSSSNGIRRWTPESIVSSTTHKTECHETICFGTCSTVYSLQIS